MRLMSVIGEECQRLGGCAYSHQKAGISVLWVRFDLATSLGRGRDPVTRASTEAWYPRHPADAGQLWGLVLATIRRGDASAEAWYPRRADARTGLVPATSEVASGSHDHPFGPVGSDRR